MKCSKSLNKDSASEFDLSGKDSRWETRTVQGNRCSVRAFQISSKYLWSLYLQKCKDVLSFLLINMLRACSSLPSGGIVKSVIFCH
jgi:hypothetical protein